jgi:type IV pilus assembly protein PilC
MSLRDRIWAVLLSDVPFTPRAFRLLGRGRPVERKGRGRVSRLSWLGARIFRRQTKLRNQLFVLDALQILVRTNAPLAAGLHAASHDAPSRQVLAVLLELRDDIDAGHSLGEAMSRLPRFFPRQLSDSVTAAEAAGNPADAFDAYREELEHRMLAASDVSLTLFYFGLLLLAHFLIVVFLLWRVVPVFLELLADFGAGLPLPFRLLNRISDIVVNHWNAINAAALATVLLFVVSRIIYRRSAKFQQAAARVLRPIPLFGTLFVRGNLSHAASVLDKLIRGGVPLHTALWRTSLANLNGGYVQLFGRLSKAVESGTSLNEALERETYLLPQSFRILMALGERSANLAVSCEKIDELYRRDVRRIRRLLVDSLVPLGVAIVGSVTFFACASLYTMLTGLTDALMADL